MCDYYLLIKYCPVSIDQCIYINHEQAYVYVPSLLLSSIFFGAQCNQLSSRLTNHAPSERGSSFESVNNCISQIQFVPGVDQDSSGIFFNNGWANYQDEQAMVLY